MKPNDEVVAHNVRFYSLEARAIQCLSLEREHKKLALSRSDNSVEIWDVKHTPYLEKLIVNDSGSSVEDIKWYKTRLFSCSLQGFISEYDCINESIVHSTFVTGGPAWCLDVHYDKRLMACGTEEGYLNILEVTESGIDHYKFLDKQQGRILCLSWDKAGEHLVTGSADIVRVWNVSSGHVVHKMTTGRSESNKETIVWSVCFTSDSIAISGDSRGCLCFWDAKTGTQMESFNSHAADILSVVLTEDESGVYCSGVDTLIAMYGRVAEMSGGRRKWAKGVQRKIHEHDVRALALSSDNKLYSGGVDGYLALSSFPPKVLIKFPPLLKGPCVKILPSKKFILLRYLSHVELWKLGQPMAGHDGGNSMLLLSEKEKHLLELRAKDNETIISSSISDDARYIAYSTDKAIRFYKFLLEDGPSLMKLPVPGDCGPCRLITFCKLNKRQFCAVVTKTNEINIMEVEESGPDVVHTIKPLETGLLIDTISHVVISQDGSFLVAADCSGRVCVWSTVDWSLHCTLPKHFASVTAISVHYKTNNVFVAYTDHRIVEFDIKEMKYTQFSKNVEKSRPTHWHSAVSSIAFDSRRDSGIVLHDDSSICVFDKDKMTHCMDSKIAKLEKKRKEIANQAQTKQPFHVIKKYRHIVSLDWLDGDEMVVVSVCPLKLAENLPPTLERKLFGT